MEVSVVSPGWGKPITLSTDYYLCWLLSGCLWLYPVDCQSTIHFNWRPFPFHSFPLSYCTFHCVCVHAKSLLSCLTLCNPMNPMEPTRFLCPWNYPGKNTGVGCHFLLQEIFPTQGWNPGFLHAGRFRTIWATREAPCVLVTGRLRIHMARWGLLSMTDVAWISSCTAPCLCPGEHAPPLSVSKWNFMWKRTMKAYCFHRIFHIVSRRTQRSLYAREKALTPTSWESEEERTQVEKWMKEKLRCVWSDSQDLSLPSRWEVHSVPRWALWTATAGVTASGQVRFGVIAVCLSPRLDCT